MAETGIMGSSGELRTNRPSNSGGAGGPFEALGNALERRAENKRQAQASYNLSQSQMYVADRKLEGEKFKAAAEVTRAVKTEKVKGKQARKNTKAQAVADVARTMVSEKQARKTAKSATKNEVKKVKAQTIADVAKAQVQGSEKRKSASNKTNQTLRLAKSGVFTGTLTHQQGSTSTRATLAKPTTPRTPRTPRKK